MRESISSTFLYNIIILFIIVTFAFLAGTLSYMKAFKSNSNLVNSIEKWEGYNTKSAEEIAGVLTTIGYKKEEINCATTKNSGELMEQSGEDKYAYCIYHFSPENSGLVDEDYYGVLTYMFVNVPIVGEIKIPIYTKTKKIYRFDTD